MARLSLTLLGTFQVDLAGERVTSFESDKVRALLVYLAVESDRPYRRETLAGLLWPERPERAARRNLSQALFKLREAIGDRAAQPPFLTITPQTLQFNAFSDHQFDVAEFSDLLVACQTHEHARLEACPPCLERLQGAVTLYQGSFLEGFSLADCPSFEEWALLTRERLRRLGLGALGHLAGSSEEQGEYESALSYAWRWLELDPWRETAQRQVMRLLALSGQREAALAQYESCRRLLREELDVDPALETTHLYEQIRAGELSGGAREQGSGGDTVVASPLPFPSAPPIPHPPAPFVGREDELGRLDEYLDTALAGQGRVVFIAGGAGRGKTALIQAFVRQARAAHPDLIVAGGTGQAYTGLGDPYLPFRDILGLLTGDVEAQYAAGTIGQDEAGRLWHGLPLLVQALLEHGPDLVGTFVSGAALLKRARCFAPGGAGWLSQLETLVERKTAMPSDPSLQQRALFEQFSRVLAALARQRPILLVLDDLQWADRGSTSLLFHLGRRLAGGCILVVGAYRPEDLSLGKEGERHPLEAVVNEFKRRWGQVEVDLGRDEEPGFVDALLDVEPNRLGERFRATLYRQTRGHPLFTVELLRGMQERGDLVRDGQGRWMEGPSLDWDTLPARVEAVIAERLNRLPERLQEVLSLASVEGETFSAEVVARVQRAEEEDMMRCLSGELERGHRMVRAQGIRQIDPGGGRLSHYRFRHILFQKYLYGKLDPVERAHGHQAVGSVLETLYGEETAQIAARLARHFQAAGNVPKAIEYLRQAGERAMRLSANEEAITHFTQGLELLGILPDTPERAQQELMLQIGLGVPLSAVNGYAAPEVGRAYARARELCRQVGETPHLFPVLCQLARFYSVRAEHQTAHEIAEQLLRLAQRSGDPQLLMPAHAMLGWNLFYLGELAQSQAHLEQATAIYNPQQHHSLVFRYGEDFGVNCLSNASWTLWLLGYPDQALKRSQEAIALAQELAHPFSLAVARFVASFFYALLRDVPATREMAEACINLSVEHRFAYWTSARMFHGWALVEQGRAETGIAQMRQGKADYNATGSGMGHPHQLALLASAYGKTGQAQEGLILLAEALETVARTGEHYYEAEIHRLQGELLQRADSGEASASPESAEACYLKAIEAARAQGAKSWELRATMSLCQMWQEQGKHEEARHMLAEIYGWFSEGFDTADLREAKALMEALA